MRLSDNLLPKPATEPRMRMADYAPGCPCGSLNHAEEGCDRRDEWPDEHDPGTACGTCGSRWHAAHECDADPDHVDGVMDR